MITSLIGWHILLDYLGADSIESIRFMPRGLLCSVLQTPSRGRVSLIAFAFVSSMDKDGSTYVD